jgi:hypothetical protein
VGAYGTLDYREPNRKRVRGPTGTSDRELAELFLKELEVKIAKGKWSFDEYTREKIRLDELIEQYLKIQQEKVNVKKWAHVGLDKLLTDCYYAG